MLTRHLDDVLTFRKEDKAETKRKEAKFGSEVKKETQRNTAVCPLNRPCSRVTCLSKERSGKLDGAAITPLEGWWLSNPKAGA